MKALIFTMLLVGCYGWAEKPNTKDPNLLRKNSKQMTEAGHIGDQQCITDDCEAGMYDPTAHRALDEDLCSEPGYPECDALKGGDSAEDVGEN